MIHFYVGLGLTLLALIALGLTLYALRKQPTGPLWQPAAALLLACVIALLAPVYASFFYKGAVALALLLLLVGRLLALVPGTPPVVAAGTHLLVYFLLWLAFAVGAGRMLWSLPALAGLLPLAAAAGVGWSLRTPLEAKRLPELKGSVLLYTLNAGLAVATAAALAAVQPAAWSLAALAGVLLFALADLLQALDAWRRPVRALWSWVWLCMLTAALLLAWSVWGSEGTAMLRALLGLGA